MPMKAFKQFDVVAVPFPFIDSPQAKKRPALILSKNKELESKAGAVICAMITSTKNSPWPLDIEIKDLADSGLPVASKVRMKLFTIDTQLILKKVGHLSPEDSLNIKNALTRVFF